MRDIKFGEALKILEGGGRVTRDSWENSRHDWICYMPPLFVKEKDVSERTKKFIKGDLRVGGYFVKVSRGVWRPGWVPNPKDVLATDWMIVSEVYGGSEDAAEVFLEGKVDCTEDEFRSIESALEKVERSIRDFRIRYG